jgi:hypothetical protein
MKPGKKRLRNFMQFILGFSEQNMDWLRFMSEAASEHLKKPVLAAYCDSGGGHHSAIRATIG